MANAVSGFGQRMWVLLALVAASACWPGATAAEGTFNAEAGFVYDSNLANAQEHSDILSDTALSLKTSGGQNFSLDDRNSVAVSADLRAAEYWRFHGMDNVALGATASYRRKFGVGPLAPWLSISGSFAREKYEQKIRDGRRVNYSILLGQRLSENLSLSGGGGVERVSAGSGLPFDPEISGDAFSLRSHNLFARTEFDLSGRWTGYLGINHRRGDIVASARFDPEILEYSSAATTDPSFGEDYVAYRLPARTWSALAGASWSVNPHMSLSFGLTRAVTHGTGEIHYQNSQFNALFLYSY